MVVQYQPFVYGRWGFAPWLIAATTRAQRHGMRVALMVHEAWVSITDWRSALMGGWQRAQLQTLARRADRVITSTDVLARKFDGAVSMPIPSNIVPVDSSPQAARAQLGLDGRLVVSLFGRSHWSRALDYAESAIAALAAALGPDRLTILNLGAGAPVPSVPPGVQLRNVGPLPADQLSLHLWASELVLLPFTAGVSTRRSTLSASLAHGRAIVGVHGADTDSMLAGARDAMVLTPVGDRVAFGRAAVALAGDPAARRALGEAGRRLYDAQFDWPVVAHRFAALLGVAAPSQAPSVDRVAA